MKRKKRLGNLLLLLTAMIWGTAFVFQRVGMESIEPITFNAARMTLGAAAIGVPALLLARRRRTRKLLSGAEARSFRRNTLLGGLGCGCCLTAASLFQQTGLVYTTAGKAGFITAMYMLLVPVVSFLLLRKRYGWPVWTAVLIGVLGMYLLCISEDFRLTKGDALECACALVFTGHILLCDHFAPRGDPIGISAVQFLTAALLSWLGALIAEHPSREAIVSAAVPILYCGLISGGVGYTLQIVAQRFTDPAVAALLMSLESVFAVLAGALLLGERMSLRESLGCAILFCAILLVQLPAPPAGRRRQES